MNKLVFGLVCLLFLTLTACGEGESVGIKGDTVKVINAKGETVVDDKVLQGMRSVRTRVREGIIYWRSASDGNTKSYKLQPGDRIGDTYLPQGAE